MQKSIKIAVAGLGRAGWDIHINELRQLEGFTLVGAVDPDTERRAEAARELGLPVHETLEALLATTDAEVVVVATPNHLHENDAIQVLRSGRHCVLEKPMAPTHAAALRIIAAAKEAGKHVFVHHQMRFDAEFRFLRETIDSGILGRVFEIRLHWGSFFRRKDWQTLRKNRGGILNNTGSHVLDITSNLLDAPIEEMLADLQHIKDAGDCEDHMHLFMKAANGQTVDLTATTACALPVPRVVLLGSCGTLCSTDGKTAKLRYFNPAEAGPIEVIDGPAPDRKYGSDDVLPWREEERAMEPSKPGGRFYANVADVIHEGAGMVVTPESAAEVIRLIEWAHQTPTFNEPPRIP